MALPNLNAIITRRVDLSPDLFVLRVSPDGWTLPEFDAGQFAVLGLPPEAPRSPSADAKEEPVPDPAKMIRRAYSIASSSRARQFLEFYVVLVRSGALTPRLHALKVGDRIWLGTKITGMFTLEELPKDVNLVLMATGTGLAPYMSMVRSHAADGLWKRVAVLHGARQSIDLGFAEELTMLDQVHESVTYLPIISRPEAEPVPWTGHSGYLQELWEKRVLHEAWGFDPQPEHTHIYLCGNPNMIINMLKILEGQGFREHTRLQAGQIHVEKYW